MYVFVYVYVYTCVSKLPPKAGFDAAILCRVAVTSSAFIFLTLFKNSVVMLFSYAVSKEPVEMFWGSSSWTGKNCLADRLFEQSKERKYCFSVKEDSEEPPLLISLDRSFQNKHFQSGTAALLVQFTFDFATFSNNPESGMLSSYRKSWKNRGGEVGESYFHYAYKNRIKVSKLICSKSLQFLPLPL